MRTIIAGSREVTDYAIVAKAMQFHAEEVTEVVSGGCRGVDALGEEWARNHSIAVKVFPADWNAHGKAAGPIRNRKMAAYAEELVAIWDGKSRGTANMIDEAKRLGLVVTIQRI